VHSAGRNACNLRVFVKIPDWSWASRLSHGEGWVQAAAGRASPLWAVAAAWLAARRRRPAVWLWSLLKQLFPFPFRKKVLNWMKEFAGNFGR